jgi:hypothetical protein
LGIVSPKANVYHNGTIDVEIVERRLTNESEIAGIFYTLDPDNPLTFKRTNLTKSSLMTFPDNTTGYLYVGRAVLENLPEGNYTLKRHVDVGGGGYGSRVNFRVDKDYEPTTLLSPLNQTYYSSDVPLVFTTNERRVYAYYCLNDEWRNLNIVNDTDTLIKGLPEGPNKLYFFVKFQDIYSDFEINFNVNSTQTDDKPNLFAEFFPLIIGLAVSLTIAIAALFLYRRHKATPL